MTFTDKLRAAQERARSWVCIGLDVDPAKFPGQWRGRPGAMADFNQAIIEATHDIVSAYKPNLAFYLAHGRAGLDALAETLASIPREIPVILDAKFGDIESSAIGYAQFAFEDLGVDAVTANPYLGRDALTPFLQYEGKAVFVLAHTSNPGSSEFQEAVVGTTTLETVPEPLFIRVAQSANRLAGLAHVGLVVGATFPEQLKDVRSVNPSAVFLIPGIGAQGGSLKEAAEYGRNAAGVGPLINASRSILYASGEDDFAQAARAAAVHLNDQINKLAGR